MIRVQAPGWPPGPASFTSEPLVTFFCVLKLVSTSLSYFFLQKKKAHLFVEVGVRFPFRPTFLRRPTVRRKLWSSRWDGKQKVREKFLPLSTHAGNGIFILVFQVHIQRGLDFSFQKKRGAKIHPALSGRLMFQLLSCWTDTEGSIWPTENSWKIIASSLGHRTGKPQMGKVY